MRTPALSTLLLKSKKGNNGRLTGWAIRYSSRKAKDYIEPGDICFAALSRNNIRFKVKEFLFPVYHKDTSDLSEIRGDKKLNKLFKIFLKDVLNYSLVKDIFLTKSVSSAIRYGIKCNTSYSCSAILGACMIIRRAWEKKRLLPAYFALRKSGLNINASLFFSHFIYLSDRDEGYFTIQSPGGHSAFGFATKDGFIKLMKSFEDSILLKDKPVREYGFGDYSINTVFFTSAYKYPDVVTIVDYLSNKGKKTLGDGWGKYDIFSLERFISEYKKFEEKYLQ